MTKTQAAPKAAKPAAQPARRPTADDIPILLAKMANDGKSLAAACREGGIHAPSVIAFLQADEKLWEQYRNVQAVRGESYGEKVAEIAEGVLTGKVDPQAGRVAMMGLQWTAGRMAPKSWGDKIEHTGSLKLKHENWLDQLDD